MGSPPSRTGPAGFDFTGHMRHLCADMVRRQPELQHIDVQQVAVSFSQTRTRTAHGLYATLTPLRFPGGCRETWRPDGRWGIQKLLDPAGRDMLYILTFYLPRFLDLPFREKLNTVVHELWHISPRCDGDLRRFPGRCYAHGGSRKDFDATVDRLAAAWLAQNPPPKLFDFLRHNFRELVARHGSVYGTRVRVPKTIRRKPNASRAKKAGGLEARS